MVSMFSDREPFDFDANPYLWQEAITFDMNSLEMGMMGNQWGQKTSLQI